MLGTAEMFDVTAAKAVMKKQWTAVQYRSNADLAGGMYSRARMLELLKQRCAYVIRRGATLNNPHIPMSYFADFEKITKNHASTLRRLVQEYVQRAKSAAERGEGPPEGLTDPIVAQAAAIAEHADSRPPAADAGQP